MRKHKTKIIAAAVILAMLAGAWFWGGAPTVNAPAIDPTATDTQEYMPFEDPYQDTSVEYDDAHSEPAEDETPVLDEEDLTIPEPIEPEETMIDDGSFTVTLSVRADVLLNHLHLLDRDKHELVPADGIIFPTTAVTAYEGDSVFDVLQREMRRNGIHMASRFTPGLNTAYIEAINNLYEFDAGPLSGWMFSINGWFPSSGTSQHLLSPNDVIELVYTLDLGRDLGAYRLEGDQ